MDKTTNKELKHCPFCQYDLMEELPKPGGKLRYYMVIEQRRINQDSRAVVCPCCGAAGPSGWTEEEAIKNWNRRGKSEEARDAQEE